MSRKAQVDMSPYYDAKTDVVLFTGNCLDLLSEMPNEVAKLIVTSPPCNLGKANNEQFKR